MLDISHDNFKSDTPQIRFFLEKKKKHFQVRNKKFLFKIIGKNSESLYLKSNVALLRQLSHLISNCMKTSKKKDCIKT